VKAREIQRLAPRMVGAQAEIEIKAMRHAPHLILHAGDAHGAQRRHAPHALASLPRLAFETTKVQLTREERTPSKKSDLLRSRV
jgi:hypothetical protein